MVRHNVKFLSSAPVFVSRSRSITPPMPEESENKEEEPDSTSGKSIFGWGGAYPPCLKIWYGMYMYLDMKYKS